LERGNFNLRVVAIILLLVIPFNLTCQEIKPEEYDFNEFPQAAKDLRRGSIIFLGAFPVGFMYLSLVSDSFLGSVNEYRSLDDQTKIEYKLIGALIFSGIVTLIDFIIEKISSRRVVNERGN